MSKLEGKSTHFKPTSPNPHSHQPLHQSTSRPLSQLHLNTMSSKQHLTPHPHSQRNLHNLSNNNHIPNRQTPLNPNHFIQSPHLQALPHQLNHNRHSYCGVSAPIQPLQQHFINRPQFPTHASLQIPNQSNPLAYTARLSYIPNSHHVHYHQAPNSIHSLHGRPIVEVPNVNPIQSSFESPHSSPSSTNTSYPIPSILNSPRSPLSKIANQDSHQFRRSNSHDQPERVVTGVLRSSLSPQQRPDPQPVSKVRPQSMTITELSARHRVAISRLQQNPKKPIDPLPSPRSSSLSKSFSSPPTSPSESTRGSRQMIFKTCNDLKPQKKKIQVEKDSKRKKSSSPDSLSPITPTTHSINSLNHSNLLLNFLKQPFKESDDLRKEKKDQALNEAEQNLLNTLPPLPPLLNKRSAKPIEKELSRSEVKSRFKDRFSWFDY
ncbi:hypothetical protein DFH28DRAFT_1122623 [Melampsora americana]|nr:hypothetical protein DFH28DRAFT_1122623 [Melampsora americana]